MHFSPGSLGGLLNRTNLTNRTLFSGIQPRQHPCYEDLGHDVRHFIGRGVKARCGSLVKYTNGAAYSRSNKVGSTFFILHVIGFIIGDLSHILVKHQKHLLKKRV